MKKFLFFFIALVAMSYAQANKLVWEKPLTDVADSVDVNVFAPIAVSTDGDVYKTGTFTKAFDFAGTTLEPIATSSYVLKYDNEGNEKWGIALQGAATVTAVTTDASGNLYLAGKFADEVVLGSVDGKSSTIKGMADCDVQVSSFIAKYDASGNLQNVKTMIPEFDADLTASGLYYPIAGDVYFRINELKVFGDKLYFTVSHTGNTTIDGITLKGRAVNVYEIMYMDIASMAALSMSTGLDNTALVANVYATANLSYEAMIPENMNVAIDDKGNVYVAWIGWGNLTMETSAGKQEFQFAYDGMGNNAHNMVVADLTSATNKVFEAPATGSLWLSNTIEYFACSDEVLNIAGTFSESCQLDTTIHATGASDMYFATLSKDLSEVDVVAISNNEGETNAAYEEMVGCVQSGENNAYVYGFIINKSTSSPSSPVIYILSGGNVQVVEDADFVTAVGAYGNFVATNSNKGKNSVLSLYKAAPSTEGFVDALWKEAILFDELVEDENDIQMFAPMVMNTNGDVYKTGTFTKAFDFAGITLEPIATSSYVLKYDNEGNEKWGIALQGAATVTAVTTDASGNLYLAGKFADEVVLGSADGKSSTIKGMADCDDQVSSFIAKYDASGNLQNVKTMIPEFDADLTASGLYYPIAGDVYFRINDLKVSGDKLYFTVSYTGNTTIDGITLKGRAVNVWDFMYMDIASMAALSMSTGLDNTALVANVYATVNLSFEQMIPEDLNVAIDDKGNVYVAWIGLGNLTMETGAGKQEFQFAFDGMGNNEHGAVIADITSGKSTVYNNLTTERMTLYNSIDQFEAYNGMLHLAGSFSDTFPFDKEKKSETACDIYYAAIDIETGKLQSLNIHTPSLADDFSNAVSTGMAIDKVNNTVCQSFVELSSKNEIIGGRVCLIGSEEVEHNDIATALSSNGTAIAFTSNYNGESLLAYYTELFSESIEETIVNKVILNPETTVIYDIQGRKYLDSESLAPGLYILTDGVNTIKVVK